MYVDEYEVIKRMWREIAEGGLDDVMMVMWQQKLHVEQVVVLMILVDVEC